MTNTYGIDPGEGLPALETRNLTVSRDSRTVVKALSMVIPSNRIVGLVGPSGCGKTTLLKSFNRMNDLDPEIQVGGEVLLHGRSIYASDVDAVEVRRRVGMVFQKPTPFPTSVYENVAFGPKVNRLDGDLDRLVEDSLRKAALWDEVNDRLFESALKLSAGQQQRLCIARALAVGPEVLLMDEPASDLDPGATQRVEELIHSLKEDYTIVLVTHNLQQAARVSDFTAFFHLGELVEYGPTPAIFTNPREARTEAYITGRLA
jgi:phosphate transport system ATP-binding protein